MGEELHARRVQEEKCSMRERESDEREINESQSKAKNKSKIDHEETPQEWVRNCTRGGCGRRSVQ